MSEEKKTIDPETAARHAKVKEDFIRLSSVIPNNLRARLELYLTDPNARQAVLELQLLAIQFGRGLERLDNGLGEGPDESQVSAMVREMFKRPEGTVTGRTSSDNSNLEEVARGLLVSVESQSKPIDPKAIVVVPGFAFNAKGGRRDH